MSTHRIDAAAVRARHTEGASIEELMSEFGESDDVRIRAILGDAAVNRARGGKPAPPKKRITIPELPADVPLPNFAALIASKPNATPADMMRLAYEIALRNGKPRESFLLPPIRIGRKWPDCDVTGAWTREALEYVLARRMVPLSLVGLGEEIPVRKRRVLDPSKRCLVLHEEYQKRIEELWLEGHDLRSIAARLDVNYGTVFKITRRLPPRTASRTWKFRLVRGGKTIVQGPRGSGGKGPAPKWRETIRFLYEAGVTRAEIAKTCGVSETTISNHVKDLAGKRRPGRPPKLSP